ncbi:blue-sensitive opsin isoform X2 [Lepeophtheirus salmonis]|uniref:blue-sensitive opsin isoform X2 n=1 Tax=Lepeophtheirus salmonis TaxID=72036 RepID=UPI001AE1C798|nr:blue-sensitive opsin-like isoform X2 [Lepeophtheirus salmonis]
MESLFFFCLSTVLLSCTANVIEPGVVRSSRNPRTKVTLFKRGNTSEPIGNIYLMEMNGVVILMGNLYRLPPGFHGFHIHEIPDLGNGCLAGGPHYNPFNKDHGGFHSNFRHVGDLGNIFTDSWGDTRIEIVDYVISLSKINDPTFVRGRSIIVHADIDDLGRGMNEGSRLTVSNQLQLSMNSYNSSFLNWDEFANPPIPPIIYGIACFYLALVGFIGCLCNSFIIFVFLRIPKVRSPFNILILNLIVTEFVVSFFGIPVDFLSSFNRGWKYGEGFCKVVGFVLTAMGIGSVYTLTILALVRLCIIFKKNYTLTLRGSFCYIGGIWLSSFFITAPPLLGWGDYIPEKSGMSCAPNWESPSSLTYIIYLFLFGFFLPVLVIITCNVKVALFLKKNTASKSMSSSVRGIAKRHERNSTIILMVMTLAFFIAWLPYTICSLYVVFGGNPPAWLSAIPLQFAKSSICASPMIYAFFNQEFRSNVMKYVQTNYLSPREKKSLLMEMSEKGESRNTPGAST